MLSKTLTCGVAVAIGLGTFIVTTLTGNAFVTKASAESWRNRNA